MKDRYRLIGNRKINPTAWIVFKMNENGKIDVKARVQRTEMIL